MDDEAAQKSRRAPSPDATFASGTCPVPTCLHCGARIAADARDPFCCIGCQTVYEALASGGLLEYYALRDGDSNPVGDLHLERRDHKWVDRHQAALADHSAAYKVNLRIQGLQCAACVWLIERLFHRQQGALGIVVNSGAGLVSLSVERPFDFLRFVREVERLGYLLADPGSAPLERDSGMDTLLLRATITSALAGNAMMFASAIYLGMEAGPLRDFLHSVNFGLSVLAVLVGAPVFVTSAWKSLRSGVLHLDLPIALGILLTFFAAAWSFFSGAEQAAYYDSLAVFVALMLWGRYLQDRVVLQNRKQLLAHQADGGLVTRRRTANGFEDVASTNIVSGDAMIVTPGDIVPVDAQVQGSSATFSLDWINGEPEPVAFDDGAIVPAGAVNTGRQAVVLTAQQSYEQSPVRTLLTTPLLRRGEGDRLQGRFAPVYVVAVLAAASTGFVRAFLTHGTVAAGLEVATAVCVVSCPCSIGLALPLAQELVQSKLRRLGLYIRDASFLRRGAQVTAIAFDKTGTLTTGHLELDNPEALRAIPERGRQVLLAMVMGSSHPHALAVLRALKSLDLAVDMGLRELPVGAEVAGQGMELTMGEHQYRLGRASFALAQGPEANSKFDTVFARDGVALGTFRMREIVRTDAQSECQKLRDTGYRLYVTSGDSAPRVSALGESLGIEADHVLFNQRPEEKAALMQRPEHAHTLMLGDGINDNLALEHAFASGTPSLDRPAVTTRADFYYVTPGLAPVRAALLASKDFALMTRRAWIFFGLYNACVVALAILGLIQPWIAAVVMPASSIASVLYVVANLKRRSVRWTS